MGGELMFTLRPGVDRNPGMGLPSEIIQFHNPRGQRPARFARRRASNSTVNAFAVVVIAKLQELAFEVNGIPGQYLNQVRALRMNTESIRKTR